MNSFKRHALQLPSTVTSVDVCHASPHDVCAAAGTRLQTYDGATAAPKRQFTRFKDTVYGAVFRNDGRLLVAGGADPVVQVFDSGSRLLLRQFKGHKAPVHVVGFTENQLHVLSGGDDGLVALWDITSGQRVCALPGHADYVRGLAGSPLDADVWATCGYDHTCKLWDLRQQRCWSSIDHQAPVEAVAFLSSGSMLATASGTDICIWDVASGRLLQRVAVHKKTATCVLVAQMIGSKPHIVSAGLDGHVKVLDADTYSPVTINKHHAPITCMAASPNGDVLVVGGANGTLLVHKKHKVNAPSAAGGAGLRWQPQRTTSAQSQYATSKPVLSTAQDGVHVRLFTKVSLSIQDELCKYRLKDALASALVSACPQIVEHVAGTLLRRGLLCSTLTASPAELVVSLLHHCRRNLSHPQHARGAIALAQHLVTFSTGLVKDAVAQAQLQQLARTVSEELEVHEHLLTLLGQMHSVYPCAS